MSKWIAFIDFHVFSDSNVLRLIINGMENIYTTILILQFDLMQITTWYTCLCQRKITNATEAQCSKYFNSLELQCTQDKVNYNLKYFFWY